MEDRRVEMQAIKTRLEEGDARMKRIEESISEILDIIQLAKGFFKVAGVLATALKYVAAIGSAIVIVYHTIVPPKS